jgi:hypothetical protein
VFVAAEDMSDFNPELLLFALEVILSTTPYGKDKKLLNLTHICLWMIIINNMLYTVTILCSIHKTNNISVITFDNI